MTLNNSPIIALNRAVALAYVNGPPAGLDTVKQLLPNSKLGQHYLTHAIMDEFEGQLGNRTAAANHFRTASQMTAVTSEKVYLNKRLLACSSRQ